MTILRKYRIIILAVVLAIVATVLILTNAFVIGDHRIELIAANVTELNTQFVSRIGNGEDVTDMKNVIKRMSYSSSDDKMFNLSVKAINNKISQRTLDELNGKKDNKNDGSEKVISPVFPLLHANSDFIGINIDVYCVTNVDVADKLPPLGDLNFRDDGNGNITLTIEPNNTKIVRCPYNKNRLSTSFPFQDLLVQFYFVVSGNSGFTYDPIITLG